VVNLPVDLHFWAGNGGDYGFFVGFSAGEFIEAFFA
jgi:hypothetical protein